MANYGLGWLVVILCDGDRGLHIVAERPKRTASSKKSWSSIASVKLRLFCRIRGEYPLIGAAGVADVLYLTATEQSAELAILRATGWTDAQVTRLILSQGAGIGLLGGLGGALAGVAGFAVFPGAAARPPWHRPTACLAAGVLLATLVAWLPAAVIRRRSVARLLAEEAG